MDRSTAEGGAVTIPHGLAHAVVGAVLAALVGGASVALGGSPWPGAVAAAFFYIGRERRQSEEWFGSNRISPLIWRARAWRDMAWPLLAGLAVCAGLEAVR